MRFCAGRKDPLAFAKRLTDSREGQYRFRIGNYRLLFDVKNNSIYVLVIVKRDKAYN